MFNVGVLGHSWLKPYIPGGSNYEISHKHIKLNYFCAPGATFASVVTTKAYSDLLVSSPDLIILVLGGNDLAYGADIAHIYQDLVHLIHLISNCCSPQLGVYVLETEKRLGDPRFINSDSYKSLRNSLVRKIKKKKSIKLLPLVKFGLDISDLGPDGVHLNQFGRLLFQTILKSHISDIIFDGEFASTEL